MFIALVTYSTIQIEQSSSIKQKYNNCPLALNYYLVGIVSCLNANTLYSSSRRCVPISPVKERASWVNVAANIT